MESKTRSKKRSKQSKKLQEVGGSNGTDAGSPALDVDDELHSLTHYAGDEEQLVDQMFAAIQGTKLEAMMPSSLKAIPLQDLKLLCAHELRGISKKRIIAIIQGNSMSDSSGSSETEESDDTNLNKHKKNRNSNDHTSGSFKPVGRGNSSEKPMDIVELEMRARLIQTMLKKDPKNSGANGINIKTEPLSDDGGSRSRSSSSKSYSRSTSRSYSRSHSRSTSYDSGSDSGRNSRHKRRSSLKSRRDAGHHKNCNRSGSRPRDDSKDKSEQENKKSPPKKTKISRKEFEVRMKKAKQNRTYRTRKDSEEEEKKNKKVATREKEERRSMKKQQKAKPAEEEAGSEKEEGEIDSNEDGGGSDYSDRSWSRNNKSSSSGHSGTRSPQTKSGSRRKSRHSKRKSRSNKKESRKAVDKSLIQASLNQEIFSTNDPNTATKQKAGIEAVDSEEDFDSPVTGISVKMEEVPNLVLRTDRTNVSFSFNKKLQPNLLQGTDLEFGRKSGPYKQTRPTKEQIVISSDSDNERKVKKISNDNAIGSQEIPMEIEKNTVPGSAEKDTDQSDLRLCEETVMKDIFADIDEENEADKRVKKNQLQVKEEPLEIGEDTISDDQLRSKKDSKSHRSSKYRGKSMENWEVKKELTSMRHHDIREKLTSTAINIKHEPWDEEASPATDFTIPTENSSIDEVVNNIHLERSQYSKLEDTVNDSEEGACSEQDTDLNESNDQLDISKSTSAERRSSNNSLEENIMPTSISDRKPVYDEPAKEVTEEQSKELSEGEISENEDGGLIDLPEEEAFEIEDEEDNNEQVSKYQNEMSICAQLEDEQEASEKTNDFYQNCQDYNFDTEKSLPDMGMHDTIADDQRNSDTSLGQVLQPLEEMEEDSGLVELQPEEAEALTAVADASLPVRRQGNTEIIGEIEPSSEASSGLPNVTENGSSWSTRWLQSEKVQKVVTSSKMLSRMRKRIKTDKIKAKTSGVASGSRTTEPPAAPRVINKTQTEETAAVHTADSKISIGNTKSVSVIGSMEEYQRVIAGQDGSSQEATAITAEEVQETNADTQKAESSEDSEDELWSKMMGN